jgi:hypothetical protein
MTSLSHTHLLFWPLSLHVMSMASTEGLHTPDSGTSQPPQRKRGRPIGSRDAVQRVRRFTKRAKKHARSSTSADPEQHEQVGTIKAEEASDVNDDGNDGGNQNQDDDGGRPDDSAVKTNLQTFPSHELLDSWSALPGSEDDKLLDQPSMQGIGAARDVELVDQGWLALHKELCQNRPKDAPK